MLRRWGGEDGLQGLRQAVLDFGETVGSGVVAHRLEARLTHRLQVWRNSRVKGAFPVREQRIEGPVDRRIHVRGVLGDPEQLLEQHPVVAARQVPSRAGSPGAVLEPDLAVEHVVQELLRQESGAVQGRQDAAVEPDRQRSSLGLDQRKGNAALVGALGGQHDLMGSHVDHRALELVDLVDDHHRAASHHELEN
jgi:hypothetical protein